MALKAKDQKHAAQIQAGIGGRATGHRFEDDLAERMKQIKMPFRPQLPTPSGCVFKGNAAELLLSFILAKEKIEEVTEIDAVALGKLATSETGDKVLKVEGKDVRRSKSDLVVTVQAGKKRLTFGVSVKLCNNNAQLFLTTAKKFCEQLRKIGIKVSAKAEKELQRFCGDEGFRPIDLPDKSENRKVNKERWFWEEMEKDVQAEWATILKDKQDDITRFLLCEAYEDDPFQPKLLLHQAAKPAAGKDEEVALFSMTDLIRLSREHSSFNTREYSVRKGSHKDPAGVRHLAPRFGIVQFQRFGNVQNATELQFNLKARYYRKPPFSPPKKPAF